jgi:hypothetical protein
MLPHLRRHASKPFCDPYNPLSTWPLGNGLKNQPALTVTYKIEDFFKPQPLSIHRWSALSVAQTMPTIKGALPMGLINWSA